MKQHACLRCGLESRCSHGSWADRHPAAAVAFAVPVAITALGAIAAYPLIFVPLLAAGVVAYIVDREHRRRAALAGRADYEHHAVMAAPIPPVRPLPQRQTHSLPLRLIHLLRTEPLRMQGNSLRL